ncbi:MAG: hypothetical protein A2077_02640 [Nitrospirae bacterium GWC2_46_6]|nr:MAG: hypothetical protein A2077_02640 [Nitrospirae bacterium GWC2_46_6]OGW20475.1 MAG: hypothetical protein A2Z82_05320 [Nitrospirae bacterium GWA2_46_11]OGW24482.1 MAG: hypothetical protein A2X55_08520 [Nitrospirae bacterium GWB2_47_37]HAK88802.1 hypothetical protein [Nitrospiraceae bacterium]HCL80997.1 hypothetical protein [Nitrospiraceae bacterium]
MKKTAVIFAVLIFVLAGSAAYAGQFGPPEPAAKEGKVALGIGYFHSQTKIQPNDTTNFKESKMTQNQAYLNMGYGLAKNWETYLRVGIADDKAAPGFETTDRSGIKSDFKDSYKPFGTIGIKGVFNVTDSFGIGPFFQASLYSSYEDSASGTVSTGSSETQTVKVKNPREINLGIGLQGKIGETIIYGGPVAYWVKNKTEWAGKLGAGTVYAATGTDTYVLSTTYKEKNNIGGFAGIRIPLSKSLNLEVEGQLKSKFSFGGALSYSF